MKKYVFQSLQNQHRDALDLFMSWSKAEHPEQRQADRCGVSTAICVLEDDGHGFHQEKNGAIKNFGFYNKNNGLHRVQPSNSLIFASKSWGSTVKIVSKIPVGGGLL